MTYYLKLFIVIFITTATTSVFSQTSEQPKKSIFETASIDDQFQYVITKSGAPWTSIGGYSFKSVRSSWINTLRTNSQDSLNAYKEEITAIQATIGTQANDIASLKSELKNSQDNLSKTVAEKDNVMLFGLSTSKDNYNLIMWSIVAVLVILLGIFIYKFKNSIVVTKKAQRVLAETEEEFEEHRKTALDREQKVRRQLQDEINKHNNTSN